MARKVCKINYCLQPQLFLKYPKQGIFCFILNASFEIKKMKKNSIILAIFLVAFNNCYSQKTSVVELVEAKKNTTEKIVYLKKNPSDSLAVKCLQQYLIQLEKIEKNYYSSKVDFKNPIDYTLLWEAGNSIAKENTSDANNLIAAILQSKDSILFTAIASTKLIEFVPSHQTSCCAFPDSYTFNDSVLNTISPKVIAALSVKKMYQQSTFYSRQKNPVDVLLSVIEIGLVNNDFKASTQNGYSKQKQNKDSAVDVHKVILEHQGTGKNFYSKYWYFIGGSIVVLLLGLFLFKRKK